MGFRASLVYTNQVYREDEHNAMEEQNTGVDTATSNNFIWLFVVIVLVLIVILRKVCAINRIIAIIIMHSN